VLDECAKCNASCDALPHLALARVGMYLRRAAVLQLFVFTFRCASTVFADVIFRAIMRGKYVAYAERVVLAPGPHHSIRALMGKAQCGVKKRVSFFLRLHCAFCALQEFLVATGAHWMIFIN
jgi:hypothetical protein